MKLMKPVKVMQAFMFFTGFTGFMICLACLQSLHHLHAASGLSAFLPPSAFPRELVVDQRPLIPTPYLTSFSDPSWINPMPAA